MEKHTHNNLDSNKIVVDGVYDGSDALKIFGNESVAGVKTFGSIPVVPTPTADNNPSTKAYLETKTVVDSVMTTGILRESADNEQETSNTSPSKEKEIQFNGVDGTITVYFELKSQNGAEPGRGQIYVNGSAVGTLRETILTSYQNYTEDIDVETGDLVQLYIWKNGTDPDVIKCQNFRLYYNQQLNNITPGTINLN